MFSLTEVIIIVVAIIPVTIFMWTAITKKDGNKTVPGEILSTAYDFFQTALVPFAVWAFFRLWYLLLFIVHRTGKGTSAAVLIIVIVLVLLASGYNLGLNNLPNLIARFNTSQPATATSTPVPVATPQTRSTRRATKLAATPTPFPGPPNRWILNEPFVARYDVDVPATPMFGSEHWYDTGIKLKAGMRYCWKPMGDAANYDYDIGSDHGSDFGPTDKYVYEYVVNPGERPAMANIAVIQEGHTTLKVGAQIPTKFRVEVYRATAPANDVP
jgi:hypothetical protein